MTVTLTQLSHVKPRPHGRYKRPALIAADKFEQVELNAKIIGLVDGAYTGYIESVYVRSKTILVKYGPYHIRSRVADEALLSLEPNERVQFKIRNEEGTVYAVA